MVLALREVKQKSPKRTNSHVHTTFRRQVSTEKLRFSPATYSFRIIMFIFILTVFYMQREFSMHFRCIVYECLQHHNFFFLILHKVKSVTFFMWSVGGQKSPLPIKKFLHQAMVLKLL